MKNTATNQPAPVLPQQIQEAAATLEQFHKLAHLINENEFNLRETKIREHALVLQRADFRKQWRDLKPKFLGVIAPLEASAPCDS